MTISATAEAPFLNSSRQDGGIYPSFVNEWYLIVLIDAYEWVELPNVTKMILFADGGYMACKPYATSGKYINRM